MNKNKNILRKLSVFIIGIVLLPALFFTAHEINSLSKNEKIVEQIYKQQMETLLFAINQYVFSYFESSFQKIDEILIRSKKQDLAGAFQKYFTKSNPIVRVTVYTSALKPVFTFYKNENIPGMALFKTDVPRYLSQNRGITEKLVKLKKQGYRKIENISNKAFPNLGNDQFILLYAFVNEGESFFVALLIDQPRTFTTVVEPKMEEIANKQFEIGCFSKKGKAERLLSDDGSQGRLIIKKDVWAFPEYEFEIQFKGKSIKELTQQRLKQSLILIIFLDVLLISGGWFIYYNIRKEIRLAQLKSDFVSNVSHELRTPLSLIRMYAETLEMGRVRDENKKRDYYKNISQESERLTHLINNILNFSRMESGKKEYQFEEVALNKLVKAVFDIYKDHVEANGFTYMLDFSENELTIQADETALSEALINLIDNAIKYSVDEQKIAIRTGQEAQSVFVEVQDWGMGIAAENHKKIFENFFREASGPVHNTKGSGLGLSLVKHIVDAHHGMIKVKSSSGKGSTFKLIFPVKES